MKIAQYIAWTQAFIATTGSIIMSRIFNFAPCELCWYQRIFMFPLVFILTIGILKRDKNMAYYALPISITGFIISIYHNLLYYGIISEAISPCRTDVPCTQKQLELFGFLTIPLLSLISFAIITLSLIFVLKENKK